MYRTSVRYQVSDKVRAPTVSQCCEVLETPRNQQFAKKGLSWSPINASIFWRKTAGPTFLPGNKAAPSRHGARRKRSGNGSALRRRGVNVFVKTAAKNAVSACAIALRRAAVGSWF